MKKPVAQMLLIACILGGPASLACGQSLYLRKPKVAVNERGEVDPGAMLKEVSMTYIDPPKPKTFKIHDQVTIIVDETSRESSKQTLDTKKDYDNSAGLSKFPSLEALLDLQLQGGGNDNSAELGIDSKQKFKGEGTYDRSDRFSARITAKVIDVKPNGILVLEARKTIQKNEEHQSIVMSGQCRTEDVSNANTVLSSQLAELTLISQQEGQVKDAATKGWIPRIIEALFAF
ncbi:MAG: flagellar basal body L-ring protein FlgH [Planctomycetes bacterium]|nr:flagellar basal body L-ring protein FlgH [Planctomycetota bacterium]